MEKGRITTAHNQYYTIYTWILETFFTVKFFLFLLKEFLRVLLLFCWYHLQDRFNSFLASCYRKATELWASASENCLIDGVGEDVVRRPNAGVLSARFIPAFAEVHIYAYFTPLSPLVSCICVYPVVVELFSRIIAISSAEISIRSPGKNKSWVLSKNFWSFLATNQVA